MNETLNPYIAGAPVTDARMFFGREDVFEWIERSLSGLYADHILVLHGQRRVGKTSVLKQLPYRLPDRYIPVFFDLQGRTHTSLDRFLWWLAREIARVLRQDRGIHVEVPDREVFSQDPEYLETRFLPGLQPHLGGRRLLLTFDEFDTLQEPEIRETLGLALVETLRQLMGREGLNFIYSVGSSGRKLENMQASYTEFFKAALYKKVSFLGREDALRLITLPAQGVLEYAPEAAERIVGITSGHPYFTQLLCHELFSQCQKTGARLIQAADVEGILPDVVERGTVNLKFVWDEASDLEKWALSGLALHPGRMDARALGDSLRHQRVRFADRDLQSAVLHLREKDVLTSENEFVIYLMRLWLQRNRPLEQVREELAERNPIASRYLEIGLEYLDSGLEEKALESFRQVLGVDPGNLSAHVRIAEVHLRHRRHAEAAAAFEKALSIDEEDVAARAGLCQARLAIGEQALARGRAKEASAVFQQVLALNPEHAEARQRMADLARQSAEKALSEGHDEDALAAFVEAIGYTPEDRALEARYQEVREEKKARILAGLKAAARRETAARSWERAIRAVEQALDLAPEDPELTGQLGALRASQRAERLQSLPEQAREFAAAERWDEALSAWQEYLSLKPSDPGQVQEEIERLRKAQALAQTYAEAQSALARRDYEQAIPILKDIVARDETYKESTRLLLQAIEARRRARPRIRLQWKGVRLPRRAWWGLAAVLGAVSVGALAILNWDRWSGVFARPEGIATRTAASTAAPLAAPGFRVCLLTEADGVAGAYYAPIWGAIEAAQTTYGIEGAYVEGTDETNATQRIEAFLAEGCDLVVSYWLFEATMQAAAAENPDVGFVVVDPSSETDLPNFLGLSFKTWEAAFLAGYLAAGMTETGIVGTFGGIDIAPVTQYMDAFVRGVEYCNEVHTREVVVLGRNPALQTGLFIDTFTDAELARQASWDLFDQGADVLFPVTGPLVTASAEAAQAREQARVIGTDFDWAQALPEYTSVLLSSAQKGYAEMVTEAIRRLVEGEFPGEWLVGNLENGGVLLAPFGELDSEVPAELAAELEALRQNAPALADPNVNGYAFPFDTITALAQTPSSPGLLYLGTEHAGFYRSDDGGQTWQPARNGLGGGAITSLAAQDADLLLASSGLAGPYRSTDGGDTWQPIHQGIDLDSLIGWGSTIVADPYRYPAFWFVDGGSVYETTDRGDTWTERERQDFQFTNLAAVPSVANALFATSSFEESGEGPSVHVSHDGGQTWTRLLELDTDFINPGQFAVDPVEGRHLYVSSASGELGTYASSDSGATWERVLDLGCDYLATVHGRRTNAYCAHGTEFFRTVDGGETWQAVSVDLPYSGAEFPSPISTLLIDSSSFGTYYVGTSSGLFVSTDSGATWTRPSSGLPLAFWDLSMTSGPGPRLYATDETGQVARSGVNAFDWEQVSSANHTSWVIHPDGELTYATDGEGLWRSTDGGATWEARSTPPNGVGRLTVSSNSTWIYSLDDRGGSASLYLSTDGGESWEVTSGLYAISDGRLIFDRAGMDRVYAVGYGELHRSDGRGRSWRPCLWTGPPTSEADSRALVDPDSIDRLLVATRGGGILISEDGCQSWGSSNDGLATLFVNTLAVDPSDADTFYAATDVGAYVSEDDGTTWTSLSDWIPEGTPVYSLVVDPQNPGVLYAATPEGVFRWELAPVPVPLAQMASAQDDWVTEFAQPILEAIDGRAPDFEDDFTTPSGLWGWDTEVPAGFEAGGLRLEAGARAYLRELAFADFVEMLDITVVQGTPGANITWGWGDAEFGWNISFDVVDASSLRWDLAGCAESAGCQSRANGLTDIEDGAALHLMILKRGSDFALYLDGVPAGHIYAESPTMALAHEIRMVSADPGRAGALRIDNVQIWDLSGLSLP